MALTFGGHNQSSRITSERMNGGRDNKTEAVWGNVHSCGLGTVVNDK